MEAALAAVANREMNGEQAAEKFRIPPSTLRDRLNGHHTKKIGRPTSFTEEEELEFCDILLSCMKVGAPLNKRKLTGIVRAIGLAKGIDEAKFGNRWHRGLLRRHSDISVRVISATSFKKAREWTKNRCEGWIAKLHSLGDRRFLDDPNGIWNLDESGFQLAQIYDKVYAQKGAQEVPAYAKGSETDRENMTLLALGNAAGKMLRALILYKGKMHIESHFADTNDEFFLSTNSSGVMDPFGCMII
ncbi:hypothetical protein RvY_04164 [Ramazzottius varieornatus]|uniref:HTH psq-type domain-containing protein n=1 Tax=Ramazzottius varieornatus TaxID=947166 RepID=A0A1D1UQP1_RAMVA|nr:hypothetical protein RvY_04164 [Ramazzottius varieornatus]